MTSIYTQIGGQEALETVVDDFYGRVLADDRLAPFFVGTNLPRLKGMQVEFFTGALDGPAIYRGRSMREVHRGRGIEQEHFDLVAEYLTESLLAAGVPAETTDSIICAIAPLSTEIVSSG